MKKFLTTALFVSVFFIGVSAIIDSASANLSSDDKALELIRAARIAIGGDQNLAEVRSMSIKGNVTHFYERDGVQNTKLGSLEINFELPNSYSKSVRIGEPGEGGGNIEKNIEVIVGKDGELPADLHGKEGVFVIKKHDGDEDVDWTTDGNNKIKVKDGKVLIEKEDGTVEEISTGDKKRIVVRKGDDGEVETIDVIGPESGDGTWETADGKKFKIRHGGDVSFGGHHRSNEMLRMTIALLMKAPEDGSVNFKYLGEGNVDGFPSNIIGVHSRGSAFKLYLDATSNLPQMVSYKGRANYFFKHKDHNKMTEKEIAKMKEHHRQMGEHNLKFSDFRNVGSLILPHRWTETAGGKMRQTIDVTSFEINPADIAERMNRGNVKLRKKKID